MEPTTTDAQLWSAMQRGDQHAFEKIYRLYSTTLYRYAAKFSQDDAAIQDCLHDLFCDIWTRRESLAPTDSIVRYLMVALRRRIIKLQSQQAMVWTAEFPLLADQTTEGEEEAMIPPGQLEKALNELSAREREALYLKYYQGMDYEQMSETMDMQYQSLRNLIHRALQKMRGLLGLWVVFNAVIKFFGDFLSTK